MESFKKICRDMAANPDVMTFSDIGRAVAKGIVLGQKFDNPLLGAVLNVSVEAGKRAVHISEKLLKDLSAGVPEAENPDSDQNKDLNRAKSSQPKLKS